MPLRSFQNLLHEPESLMGANPDYDRIYRELLSGNDKLRDIAMSANPDQDQPMALFVLHDQHFRPETFDNIISRIDLMYGLNEMFTGALTTMQMTGAQLCWINHEKLLIVLVTKLSQANIHSFLAKLSDICPSGYSGRITASDEFREMKDIPHAILTALLYAEYARFIEFTGWSFDQQTRMAFIDELKQKHPDYYLDNYERPIISAAINGNITQALVLTNHFLIMHLVDEISVFPTTFSILKSILRLIMSLIAENPRKLHESNPQYEMIQYEVENSTTLKQMQQAIARFFTNAELYISNNKDYTARIKKVDDIVKFIQDNFKDCLLCEALICDRFGLSISYLSRLFKEYIGVNLSTYIQMMRIDEAKRLIASGGDTMDDIALRVGYSSGQTLIRLFRKYEGMTPSSYKRLATGNI